MSAPQSPAIGALAIPTAVTWRDVEGELVLFDARDGRYHALDRVASQIWRLVGRHGSLERTIEHLQREYAGAEADVAADVREFVERAIGLGLIENTGR